MQGSTLINQIVFRKMQSDSENRARTREAMEHQQQKEKENDRVPDADDAAYMPEERLIK
jgi:hypothetical protein